MTDKEFIELLLLFNSIVLAISHLVALCCDPNTYSICAFVLGLIFTGLLLFVLKGNEDGLMFKILIVAKITCFDFLLCLYFLTQQPFKWNSATIDHLLTILLPSVILICMASLNIYYVLLTIIWFCKNFECQEKYFFRLISSYYGLLQISHGLSYYNSPNNLYLMCDVTFGILFTFIFIYETDGIYHLEDKPLARLLPAKIICFDFPTRIYILTQQSFQWNMQYIDHLLTLFVPTCILVICCIYLVCKLIIDFCENPSCKPQQLIKLVLVYYALLPISHICSIYYSCSNIVYLLYSTIIGILFNLIFYSELDDMQREHFNPVQGLLVVKIIFFDCAIRGYFLTQQQFEISMQQVDHILTLFVPCFLITVLVIMTILVIFYMIEKALIDFNRMTYKELLKLLISNSIVLAISHLVALCCDPNTYSICAFVLGLIFTGLLLFVLKENEDGLMFKILIVAKITCFDFLLCLYFFTQQPFKWNSANIDHLLTILLPSLILICMALASIFYALWLIPDSIIEICNNFECSEKYFFRLISIYYGLLLISRGLSYCNSPNNLYLMFDVTFGILYTFIFIFQTKEMERTHLDQPLWGLLPAKIICFDVPTRIYLLTQQSFQWNLQYIDHLLTLFVPSCILAICCIYLVCKLINDFCENPSCKPQQLIKLVLVYYALLPISHICSIFYGCSHIVYLLCSTIIGILFNLIFYSELDDMQREHFNPVQGLLVGKIILFDCATRGYFLTQQQFEISVQYIDHILTLFVPCILIIFSVKSLIDCCKNCKCFNIQQDDINNNQVMNVHISQNFIDFKRQYRQTQTYIKIQQYIRDSLLVIDIVQHYYLLSIITQLYSYIRNNTYTIYLLTTGISRIIFMLNLRIHRRDMQINDWQLSLIFKQYCSELDRQYPVDELDRFFEQKITIFLFLMSKMLFILFGIINFTDFICSTYLLVYGNWHSFNELIDYLLTLLPSYLFLAVVTLFIALITPVIIAWPYICYLNIVNLIGTSFRIYDDYIKIILKLNRKL